MPTSAVPADDADRQPGAEHAFPVEQPEGIDPELLRGVSQADADRLGRHLRARALGRAYLDQRDDGTGDVERRR